MRAAVRPSPLHPHTHHKLTQPWASSADYSCTPRDRRVKQHGGTCCRVPMFGVRIIAVVLPSCRLRLCLRRAFSVCASCRGEIQAEGPDPAGKRRHVVHGQRTSGGHQVRPGASLDATASSLLLHSSLSIAVLCRWGPAERPAPVSRTAYPAQVCTNVVPLLR